MSEVEKTLAIIKPDAVSQGHTEAILQDIARDGDLGDFSGPEAEMAATQVQAAYRGFRARQEANARRANAAKAATAGESAASAVGQGKTIEAVTDEVGSNAGAKETAPDASEAQAGVVLDQPCLGIEQTLNDALAQLKRVP